MPTPAALADLAESLVPIATRLVGAVHDDGIAAVARVLSEVAPEHHAALAVVVAAMVDPERTPAELLSWVTWDDETPPPVEQPTLLTLAVDPIVDVAALPRDPAQWSDEVCRTYWRRHRRVGGTDDADEKYLQLLGYREWERRRVARRRQAS